MEASLWGRYSHGCAHEPFRFLSSYLFRFSSTSIECSSRKVTLRPVEPDHGFSSENVTASEGSVPLAAVMPFYIYLKIMFQDTQGFVVIVVPMEDLAFLEYFRYPFFHSLPQQPGRGLGTWAFVTYVGCWCVYSCLSFVSRCKGGRTSNCSSTSFSRYSSRHDFIFVSSLNQDWFKWRAGPTRGKVCVLSAFPLWHHLCCH